MRRLAQGSLVRQFALLSLLLTALTTVALVGALSYYLKQDSLKREWAETATYIRKEAAEFLSPQDFRQPESEDAVNHLRHFYWQTTLLPDIVRVKIWDATGKVIWSDEPRLIGRSFPDNVNLRGALRGQTQVKIQNSQTRENVYERSADLPRLVEVYVPITRNGSKEIIGVVEAYQDANNVFRSIRRAQIIVAVVGFGGGAVLYLSLFWIVRRASRRIAFQHHALRQRGAQLAAANQELRSVQKQLIDAERLATVGEVVTAVAHGIRNPLANIRAAAQIASLDCSKCVALGPLAPRNLASIMSEVDRLDGRIRELLQFVRTHELRKASIDMNALIQQCLGLVSGRLESSAITVVQKLDPELPAVTGDPILLEQVFLGLLTNAIDAMRDGGTVTLTTATRHDDGHVWAAAEVADTGAGIAEHDLPRIFDLFYTTKRQGTGLGLSLARRFVEAHHGAITVDTARGAGSIFRVTLPATEVPA